MSGHPGVHKTMGKTNQSAVEAPHYGMPQIAVTASFNQA
jgi:hypothetical protein